MLKSTLKNSTLNSTISRLVHTTTVVNSKMNLELVSSAKCFEGEQRFYSHFSDTVKCKMNIGVYLPPAAIKDNEKCPVLYHLNGLTATHENFIQKSGFQRYAAQFNICVVCPDTSPRDVDVPNHDVLGPGAGFYLDAIQEPWAKHFQMFSYVTKELITLVNENLPVIKGQQSIFGFSMGGYGALVCSLRNPGLYRSVSAFAPVCNPIKGPKGRIALQGYIGNDVEKWNIWDPCFLAANYSGQPLDIFIEQGTCDEYTPGKELLPEDFVKASKTNDRLKTTFIEREGYNHSHYYISTFVHEHFEYHAKYLKSK